MKTMLVFTTLCTLVLLFVSAKAESKSKNCNEVKAAYRSKGFNANDVPNKGVHGEFAKYFFMNNWKVAFLFTITPNVFRHMSQCNCRSLR